MLLPSQIRRGGGLQAAVRRAKGSKEEYFGLETEPTSKSDHSPVVGERGRMVTMTGVEA